MSTSIEERLRDLGIILPEASDPAANYTNGVIAGSLFFVAGKGPSGKPKGKLGQAYSTEEGYQICPKCGN